VERRFVLEGVPWWTYVALRDALDGEGAGVRMTYLEGTLEVRSPSTLHEDAKKLIARLLEVWATELDVPELARFVRPGESQTKLARGYRDALRARAK
jgi:hypothetical protein